MVQVLQIPVRVHVHYKAIAIQFVALLNVIRFG